MPVWPNFMPAKHNRYIFILHYIKTEVIYVQTHFCDAMLLILSLQFGQ